MNSLQNHLDDILYVYNSLQYKTFLYIKDPLSDMLKYTRSVLIVKYYVGKRSVVGAVTGAWSIKNRDWNMQSVGGTHTAQLSSAGLALAGWLPPVCLKSLGKGQIKVRAKGHNAASTSSKAAGHLTEYICVKK